MSLVAATLVGSGLAVVPAAAQTVVDDIIGHECLVEPSLTPAGLAQSGVQAIVVGEDLTFVHRVAYQAGDIQQNVFERADGTSYWGSFIETIALDSNLTIDGASVRLSIAPGDSVDIDADKVAQTLVAGTEPDPDDFVLDTDTSVPGQTTWRVIFPADADALLADPEQSREVSRTVPAEGEIFLFEFDAIRAPLGGDAAGEVERGAECFARVSTPTSNAATDRSNIDVALAVPFVEIEKNTPIDNAYQPGTLVPYEVVVSVPQTDPSGALTNAPARDVVVVDTLPDGLVPVDAAGVPLADGATNPQGGVWDLGGRTLTFQVGDVLTNEQVVVAYELMLEPGTAAGTTLTNTATASYSSLPGTGDPADQVVDPGPSDSASIVALSSDPTVTKQAGLEKYGPLLDFPYTVTIDLPAGAVFSNFTVVDTLPQNLEYRGGPTQSCTGASDPANCPTLTQLATVGAYYSVTGTRIGWYAQDIPVDPNPRQIVITYNARFRSTTHLEEFENDLTLRWNTVDRLGNVIPNLNALPRYDGRADSSDIIIYDRPELDVDKVADLSTGEHVPSGPFDWDYEPGDSITYTGTITNEGTEPSLNMVITDAGAVEVDLASILIDLNDGAGQQPCVDCVASGTTFTWTYAGPLDPGESLTIVYDAVPADSGQITNVLRVSSYEDPVGTPYLEQPADSVVLNIPEPRLELAKDRAIAAGSDTGQSGYTQGTHIPFRFEITNISNVSARNVTVTDRPPAGFCGTESVHTAGVTATGPGVWVLDADLGPGATFVFEADIEVCTPDVGIDTHVNEADLTWEDTADGFDSNGDPYIFTDDAALVIDEVFFEVTKFPQVNGGATILQDDDATDANTRGGAWVVEVENTGDTALGGLQINDPMPETFEYEPGTAFAIWIGGEPQTFQDLSVADGATVYAGHTNEAVLLIDNLQPGQRVRFTIPFVQNGELPADGVYDMLNVVTVSNPALAEGLTAEGEYSIVPLAPGPSVVKTVGPVGGTPPDPADPGYLTDFESTPAAPGNTALFVVDVTIKGDEANPANPLTSHDVLIWDLLPDGLDVIPAGDPAPDELEEPTPHTSGTAPTAPWQTGTNPEDGWSVTCLSGPCTAEYHGAYLGHQNYNRGRTGLFFYFGDYTNTDDSIYRITIPVRVGLTFEPDDSGLALEVIDGVREPFWNFARPYFNLDTDASPTANGDAIVGFPTGIPTIFGGAFDAAYPKDRANVDIVTPPSRHREDRNGQRQCR